MKVFERKLKTTDIRYCYRYPNNILVTNTLQYISIFSIYQNFQNVLDTLLYIPLPMVTIRSNFRRIRSHPVESGLTLVESGL